MTEYTYKSPCIMASDGHKDLTMVLNNCYENYLLVFLFCLFIQYFKRSTLLANKPFYQVALYSKTINISYNNIQIYIMSIKCIKI